MSATTVAELNVAHRFFDEAAPDYDRVASLMAFGSGRWYRRCALARAGLTPGMRVLDVAIGTGLVAQEALRIVGPRGSVVGVDLSAGMLARAAAAVPVPLSQGRSEALPFRTSHFDFASLGYALRHLDQPATFAEMFRVLRPGGVACILEISVPSSTLLRHVLGLYIGRVVPLLARATGSRTVTADLWKYFWHTIEHAVPPAGVVRNLEAAGFRDTRRRLVQAIFSEYTARKP